jgi:hypothetical protein
LENNVWKELSEYPTDLIEKCHQYRKVSISKLSIEQIRLLVSQQIGLEHIIGIALNKLEQNILAAGDFYAGDLLIAVSKIPMDFWNGKKTEFFNLKKMVGLNSDLIKTELAEKDFNKLLNRLENGL